MNNINKYVESKYMKLYKKYTLSRTLFIVLNVLSFFLIALMIILNIYAIKKNPLSDTKIYFVVISILSGFVALLTSLASFFSLRKKSSDYKERYEQIKDEYKAWEKGKGKYTGKDKDGIIIDEILRINSGEE